MEKYIYWVIIFIILLFLIHNKLNRLIYKKNWLRNNESHAALAIQQYLQSEGYTETQAVAVAISSLKLINKIHVRSSLSTT